ncbi:50S ribosomal protein L17 [Candidatus Gottesmanbacteria bacterium]|nr:50S ribosomal protein L17 [Candidatus Gottesmanbacteria bacterium]
MRHGVFGKQLSRSKNERRRLRQGLLRDLFTKGAIVTSKAKAQSVRGVAEKLITKAKNGSDQKKREACKELTDSHVVEILWQRARVQWANRTSGFTRVSILGQRRGDATTLVKLSFVDEEVKKTEDAKIEKPKKAEVKKKIAAPKITSVKAKNTKKPVKK